MLTEPSDRAHAAHTRLAHILLGYSAGMCRGLGAGKTSPCDNRRSARAGAIHFSSHLKIHTMTGMHGDETTVGQAGNAGGRGVHRWRAAAWAVAALILVLPLVAMQFTDEVSWNVADFVFAGALILGTGLTYELTVRKTRDTAYRAAVGLALAAAFILVWVNGAVGIIGAADNDANLLYGGVLAVGLIGALMARFRPSGMAWALVTTAVVQALVGVTAMIAGFGAPASGPLELLFLNGFFVVLWLASAWLFWAAAGGESERGAV